MKTVTKKVKAYINSTSKIGPQDIINGNRLHNLNFVEEGLDMSGYGWTFVGNAEITLDVPDEKALIENKVAALREEAKLVKADATARVTQIEGQIQSLLAISCDAVVAVVDSPN